MSTHESTALETDPRFPSGRWTGFFVQPHVPGRHRMELHLTFRQGQVTGECRHWVGQFDLCGRYDTDDGKCHCTKRCPGNHDVFCKGYAVDRGIYGRWEIPTAQNLGLHWHGGFNIWPEGMDDPTQPHLAEEADPPV